MERATIGDRIKEARLKRGMTSELLAKRAGVTRTAISYIENRGGVTIPVLRRIAAALGVEPGDLL